jgi:hypothetical protein
MRKLKRVDHIDPLKSEFVCGFDIQLNAISADISYNRAKSNAFVPYRVKDHLAPQRFGDLCEFLIQGEWIICEFGSNKWWKEAYRLGYSRTNKRGTKWFHDPNTGFDFMVTDEEAYEFGLVKGRKNFTPFIPIESSIKGKKAFTNGEGEVRYFYSNPDPSVWKRGLSNEIRQNMSQSHIGVLKRPDLVESSAEMVDFYNKGMSTTHLALLFSTNHRTVSKILKEQNVELRGKFADKKARELSKQLYATATANRNGNELSSPDLGHS